ncbi:hypothetical protein BF49_2551 [Bradyrhizobium sp.]|uniref:hypothetical protein n=1 Tax=Bradyrhizobium sp. TaxID=376 RepID=UPI0007C1A57F|nr:hypothetical protein [Bradyrhizobium sp.]CUT11471.1 hypothetical protein BF49_2551 [Bradyrhizobium sp.]
MSIKSFPKDTAGRLEHVGQALYGACWRKRLAGALQISCDTLYQWLHGRAKATRDVDAALIDLLDAERDACAERGVQITALRRQLIAR